MYIHASHGYSVYKGLKRDKVSLLVLGTEPWSSARARSALEPGANSSLVRFFFKKSYIKDTADSITKALRFYFPIVNFSLLKIHLIVG